MADVNIPQRPAHVLAEMLKAFLILRDRFVGTLVTNEIAMSYTYDTLPLAYNEVIIMRPHLPTLSHKLYVALLCMGSAHAERINQTCCIYLTLAHMQELQSSLIC